MRGRGCVAPGWHFQKGRRLHQPVSGPLPVFPGCANVRLSWHQGFVEFVSVRLPVCAIAAVRYVGCRIRPQADGVHFQVVQSLLIKAANPDPENAGILQACSGCQDAVRRFPAAVAVPSFARPFVVNGFQGCRSRWPVLRFSVRYSSPGYNGYGHLDGGDHLFRDAHGRF